MERRSQSNDYLFGMRREAWVLTWGADTTPVFTGVPKIKWGGKTSRWCSYLQMQAIQQNLAECLFSMSSPEIAELRLVWWTLYKAEISGFSSYEIHSFLCGFTVKELALHGSEVDSVLSELPPPHTIPHCSLSPQALLLLCSVCDTEIQSRCWKESQVVWTILFSIPPKSQVPAIRTKWWERDGLNLICRMWPLANSGPAGDGPNAMNHKQTGLGVRGSITREQMLLISECSPLCLQSYSLGYTVFW